MLILARPKSNSKRLFYCRRIQKNKSFYRLRPDHFAFLKTIGKGSFGRVYLVRYKADNKIYAMKILGKARILKRNEIKHVMAERNVVCFLDALFDHNLKFANSSKRI